MSELKPDARDSVDSVLEYTIIYETVHGSRAFNLQRLDSDLDLKGIIIGPRDWYCGYLEGPEQIICGSDHCRFEIRKFFRLAASSNPMALEMLWTDPAHHVLVTPAGEKLLANRQLFLSRRIRETFAGYALSQLKRIKTHRHWLLHPPQREPVRADFGLPDRTLISPDQLGAEEALHTQKISGLNELSPNFLDILNREKQYRQVHREWEQYQTWLKQRNPQRAALEIQFGYDTKHAMHLIRLLRMAIEILETNHVEVYRPDREELLAIRDGAWKYDFLIEQCEWLDSRIEAAAARSALPAEPEGDAINRLCVSIVEEVFAC